MDNDIVVWIVVLLLLAVGGWVLGVVGFFSSRRALREIAELRRRSVTAPLVVPEAIPEPPPASVPSFIPEPVSQPEPADAGYVAEAQQPASRPDFETLLTTRWGVWLGAAALLLAGVFLIRYAVDQGLLGPATRCVLAGLLGVALLLGAEWLRRREAERQVLADRAAPGLAAGGVAVLFGAAYGAGVLYGLVPPLVGFALMAAASLVGHGDIVAAWPTGRRGRHRRRVRVACAGADRATVAAGPVPVSAVRHRRGTRRGALHRVDLAWLGNDDRRRGVVVAGPGRRHSRRYLGCRAVRACRRGIESRAAAAASARPQSRPAAGVGAMRGTRRGRIGRATGGARVDDAGRHSAAGADHDRQGGERAAARVAALPRRPAHSADADRLVAEPVGAARPRAAAAGVGSAGRHDVSVDGRTGCRAVRRRGAVVRTAVARVRCHGPDWSRLCRC